MNKLALLVGLLFVCAACTTQSYQAKQPAKIKKVGSSPMILIPAGDFKMGNNYDEYDEGPQHKLYLKSFYLDKYEVSNNAYENCVDRDKCAPSDFSDDSTLNGSDLPVVGINANDAKSYCEFVGKRLPTEAEWEKAARGPSAKKWPWGDEQPSGQANIDGEADGYAKTAPVTAFPGGKSIYGIFNMAGNVAEWVADSYDPVFYKKSPGENPFNHRPGDPQVHRGGSYLDGHYVVRTTKRAGQNPFFRSNTIGIRCAKSARD